MRLWDHRLGEYESSSVREYVSTRYETMILYDYETMKLWDYDDDMVRAEDDNEDEESREQRVESREGLLKLRYRESMRL